MIHGTQFVNSIMRKSPLVLFYLFMCLAVAFIVWNQSASIQSIPRDGLSNTTDPRHRFYALGDAAKYCFNTGKFDEAGKHASELLELSQRYRSDWNFGNAIHDGNMILGRIAVHDGRIDDAKRFLEAAGSTPGSPQLDTFGPDMSLASDLLDVGEAAAVVFYIDKCRSFWEMHDGKLDFWASELKAGRRPRFARRIHH